MKNKKNVDEMLAELLSDDESESNYDDEREVHEMYEKQLSYEESLIGLPYDHPSVLFKHSFLRPGYLPVEVVKMKKDKVYTLPEVAEEMSENAYVITGRGTKKLNQQMFCEIWEKRFHYIYAGVILTPDGAIDIDKFKSDIVRTLFLMRTETANLDTLAEHLYKTYISAFKMDAYTDENKIPFRNGDLVLNEDNKGYTFYEGRRSPVPYRFDYDFKNIPNCLEPEFPNFKKWRDDLFDLEDQYTLKQMLGYLLLPNNEAQEAFFILGKGGTGKSILTDCIIPTMLGRAFFPISIGSFFNNQFQVGTSEGKLCMVDDDIGETYLTKNDSGRFKNFVTAETIQIEHKHCNPAMVNNSARIVCAGNHMIYSDDKTDGFTRRLHPIYVKPRQIVEVDSRLRNKVKKEISSIVLWALEGILEMRNANNKPYWSDRSMTLFAQYAEGQKWQELFISEMYTYSPNTVTYANDIRDVLSDWLKDNSEVSGQGSVYSKYCAVIQWLKDEGADKYGFEYKRGIKKGDNYNARGYLHMTLKEPLKNPIVYTDEKGNLKIRINKKKNVDSGDNM